MSMLAAPNTITGPLRAEDLDRDTNPGNVWLMPRRGQCPPCNGHCRQGRECPGPDTVPTDYGSLGWLDSCAPEGGKHAEPVPSAAVSMRRHDRIRYRVALVLLVVVTAYFTHIAWPLLAA